MGRLPFALRVRFGYHEKHGPVAQLDRALPSEGRGRTFESCRVRQFFNGLAGTPKPGLKPEVATR